MDPPGAARVPNSTVFHTRLTGYLGRLQHAGSHDVDLTCHVPILARDVISLMLRCQCPFVCPYVCDGSALAHYS